MRVTVARRAARSGQTTSAPVTCLPEGGHRTARAHERGDRGDPVAVQGQHVDDARPGSRPVPLVEQVAADGQLPVGPRGLVLPALRRADRGAASRAAPGGPGTRSGCGGMDQVASSVSMLTSVSASPRSMASAYRCSDLAWSAGRPARAAPTAGCGRAGHGCAAARARCSALFTAGTDVPAGWPSPPRRSPSRRAAGARPAAAGGSCCSAIMNASSTLSRCSYRASGEEPAAPAATGPGRAPARRVVRPPLPPRCPRRRPGRS